MDDKQLLNKSFKIGKKEFVVRSGLKQWQQIMVALKDVDFTKVNKLFSQDVSEDDQATLMLELIGELVKSGVMPEVLSFILKPADGKWNEQDAAVVREYFEEGGEDLIPRVLMAFFLSKTNLIKEITNASKSLTSLKQE